jgi:diguanylate cyclase (GGDEF)-like protein
MDVNYKEALQLLKSLGYKFKSVTGSIAWQQEIVNELVLLSTIDPLTGTRNRRYVEREAHRTLQKVARGHSAALLAIDLDHFKRINDTFGHSVGDKTLIGVAKIMMSHIRCSDIVARMGGEEFCILLDGMEPSLVPQTAEHIRQRVLQELTGDTRVSISIGVSILYSGETETFDGWWRRADRCLYTAKSLGRNRVVVENSGNDCGN